MVASQRLYSIDRLRGLVIILMALDHVRDFFAPTPFWPDDVSQTTPEWFFTRWITHLCAPLFILLAGTSAFLREQKFGKIAMSHYLATRGLMLVILEVTIISFSWQLSTTPIVFLQVIWAIGVSMIVLAALIHLPNWAIAIFAFGQIVLHNLLDQLNQGDMGFAYASLHFSAYFPWHSSGWGAFVAYPLIPWMGVMAVGYLLGNWMIQASNERQKKLVWTGVACIVIFLILRAVNLYGDPVPWSEQERGPVYTLLSFLNLAKYPPSLLYLLITIGPGLLLLRWFEKVPPVGDSVLLLFGRHPLFFYLIHIPIIHLLAMAYAHFTWGEMPSLFGAQPYFPPGYEASLLRLYLAWISILILLWAACHYWDQYQQKKRLVRR